MIPNAAAWLLPEFYDLANALNMVVDMPSILPHGTRIDTTSDGFLIWLPSCAHGPRCLLWLLTSRCACASVLACTAAKVRALRYSLRMRPEPVRLGERSPAIPGSQLRLQVWLPAYDFLIISCQHLLQLTVTHARSRYGIQIGQAFGFDFGYGIIKDICFISFAIV